MAHHRFIIALLADLAECLYLVAVRLDGLAHVSLSQSGDLVLEFTAGAGGQVRPRRVRVVQQFLHGLADGNGWAVGVALRVSGAVWSLECSRHSLPCVGVYVAKHEGV